MMGTFSVSIHLRNELTQEFLQVDALMDTGAVRCWGANSLGQLGDGFTEDRSRPLPVSGGRIYDRVSARVSHTCAVATDGVGYCWGSNLAGQLGDGTSIDHSTPTPVSSSGPITEEPEPQG